MSDTATLRYDSIQSGIHANPQLTQFSVQAIGIQPDSNTIAVTTKTSKQNQPAKLYHTASYSSSTPSRKLYKSIVSSTAKKGYRPDLRAEAVSRASAVRQSQREKKVSKAASKPRGAKAKKAREAQFLKLTPEN
jgi:large subunit ribosomal protein L28e